jgi:hypothetical protein
MDTRLETDEIIEPEPKPDDTDDTDDTDEPTPEEE